MEDEHHEPHGRDMTRARFDNAQSIGSRVIGRCVKEIGSRRWREPARTYKRQRLPTPIDCRLLCRPNPPFRDSRGRNIRQKRMQLLKWGPANSILSLIPV